MLTLKWAELYLHCNFIVIYFYNATLPCKIASFMEAKSRLRCVILRAVELNRGESEVLRCFLRPKAKKNTIMSGTKHRNHNKALTKRAIYSQMLFFFILRGVKCTKVASALSFSKQKHQRRRIKFSAVLNVTLWCFLSGPCDFNPHEWILIGQIRWVKHAE